MSHAALEQHSQDPECYPFRCFGYNGIVSLANSMTEESMMAIKTSRAIPIERSLLWKASPGTSAIAITPAESHGMRHRLKDGASTIVLITSA